eukprot:TRINITY_DN10176_c0_g1_i1.p1 TRINITY_DN10176_c0_g1~~TRINITY_DN10176_c0_g1_i1.p1  ORF type:complete len:204 (+),score=39.51 TRINITY_DN10176_c0_g1_i1:46-612(+)
MPRQIHHEYFTDIPEHVYISIKHKSVTVKGPKGSLTRFFNSPCDITVIDGKKVKVEMWFSTKKQRAAVRTVSSHIANMIKGVTKGFLYKMRMVYAHFPITVNVENAGKTVEIRNFLGEKIVRTVALPEGVKCIKSKDVKDQIELIGADIRHVSQSAAKIHHKVAVRNKDIRKFLDGMYVSQKTVEKVD